MTIYSLMMTRITALLLLVYPACMITLSGGMNGVFLLLLLVALLVAVRRPDQLEKVYWRREWTYYLIAMLSISIAVFLSQSYHHQYDISAYDNPARYWLAVPILLLLYRMPLQVLSVLQYAFPAGALAGLLFIEDFSARQASVATMDTIHYGGFQLILGVLSLCSIHWFHKDPPWALCFKWAGVLAGFTGLLLSGTRGSWLALPLFVLIRVHWRLGGLSILRLMMAGLVSAFIFFCLYYLSPTMQDRIQDAFQDIQQCQQGFCDTNVGNRLQAYSSAVAIYLDNPLFGVGPDGFPEAMEQRQAQGLVTPYAVQFAYGEVHSDILAKAARLGSMGLVAILLVFLVPAWLFFRALSSTSTVSQTAGLMGILLIAGIVSYGLTVEFLNLTMAAAFYSFTVAALLAVHYNQQSVQSTVSSGSS